MKKDVQYHGYGMLSMRTIAEKYGGTLAVELVNNIFNLNIIFPSVNIKEQILQQEDIKE